MENESFDSITNEYDLCNRILSLFQRRFLRLTSEQELDTIPETSKKCLKYVGKIMDSINSLIPTNTKSPTQTDTNINTNTNTNTNNSNLEQNIFDITNTADFEKKLDSDDLIALQNNIFVLYDQIINYTQIDYYDASLLNSQEIPKSDQLLNETRENMFIENIKQYFVIDHTNNNSNSSNNHSKNNNNSNSHISSRGGNLGVHMGHVSMNLSTGLSSRSLRNLINLTDDEDSRVSRSEFIFHFIRVMIYKIGVFWDVTNKLDIYFHSREVLQLEMIEKIIERYWEANLLDICIVDNNGHSLYHIATGYDVDSVFKLLLNIDNDVLKYKNNFGKSVIDEAKYFGRWKIYEQILFSKMNDQMKYETQLIANRLEFERGFVDNFLQNRNKLATQSHRHSVIHGSGGSGNGSGGHTGTVVITTGRHRNNNNNNNNNDVNNLDSGYNNGNYNNNDGNQDVDLESTKSKSDSLAHRGGSSVKITDDKSDSVSRGVEPRCDDCGGTFSIVGNPSGQYNGKGITCAKCKRSGANELASDQFFYQCSDCGMTDICASCYVCTF